MEKYTDVLNGRGFQSLSVAREKLDPEETFTFCWASGGMFSKANIGPVKEYNQLKDGGFILGLEDEVVYVKNTFDIVHRRPAGK